MTELLPVLEMLDEIQEGGSQMAAEWFGFESPEQLAIWAHNHPEECLEKTEQFVDALKSEIVRVNDDLALVQRRRDYIAQLKVWLNP